MLQDARVRGSAGLPAIKAAATAHHHSCWRQSMACMRACGHARTGLHALKGLVVTGATLLLSDHRKASKMPPRTSPSYRRPLLNLLCACRSRCSCATPTRSRPRMACACACCPALWNARPDCLPKFSPAHHARKEQMHPNFAQAITCTGCIEGFVCERPLQPAIKTLLLTEAYD